MTVVVDGASLTLEQLVRVSRDAEDVALSPTAEERVRASSGVVKEMVDGGATVYGVTTGFGELARVRVSREHLRELQENLLRSHAAGVGRPFPVEVVRGAMLLRANALAIGLSGVRLETVQLLIDMLNARVHPIMPSQGSVGASGDLAPLAHMALVLIGEGEAEYRGEVLRGGDALRSAKLKPIRLGPKEGLALTNGTQVMTALSALAVHDARNLLKAAQIASAMSLEALMGTRKALDPGYTLQEHILVRSDAHGTS